MDKPVAVLFDFDGTLTRRDSMPLFVRHAVGNMGLLRAILSNLPALSVLAVRGWKSMPGADAGKTKECLLRCCFAQRSREDVERLCATFADKIDEIVAPAVLERLQEHLSKGHRVAIVSASVDVWIKPWAARHGVTDVIATQEEVVAGSYTGCFAGENCNGEEKVRRISEIFPREKFHLVAYGNSRGDYPMLRYADEAFLCNNDEIKVFE